MRRAVVALGPRRAERRGRAARRAAAGGRGPRDVPGGPPRLRAVRREGAPAVGRARPARARLPRPPRLRGRRRRSASPHDDRDPRRHGGTHAAVLSEPWILDALEHGFDATTLPIARALLRVQERRFARTGKLTAMSEDALDRRALVRLLGHAERRRALDRVRAGRDAASRRTSASRRRPPSAGACCSRASYPDRLLGRRAELVARRGGSTPDATTRRRGRTGPCRSTRTRSSSRRSRTACAARRCVAASRRRRRPGDERRASPPSPRAGGRAAAASRRAVASAVVARPAPRGRTLRAAGARAGGPRPLADPDLEAAQIAWRYFERNYHPETGLVSSVEGYPSTSVWDVGLDAARDGRRPRARPRSTRAAFDARVDDAAPDARDAAALRGRAAEQGVRRRDRRDDDYANQPAAAGIGFSALDLGRLVSALTLLAERCPAAPRRRSGACSGAGASAGSSATASSTARTVDAAGKVQIVQEGRFGYEQYAAQSFARLGFGMARARAATTASRRTRRSSACRSATTRATGAGSARWTRSSTDPWVLGAFEFGRDGERGELLRRVFEVQKRRWEKTGIVDRRERGPRRSRRRGSCTARSGRTACPGTPSRPAATTPRGSARSRRRRRSRSRRSTPTIRTRACSAAPSTRARDPDRGWYAGMYEDGATQPIAQREHERRHPRGDAVRARSDRCTARPRARPRAASADAGSRSLRVPGRRGRVLPGDAGGSARRGDAGRRRAGGVASRPADPRRRRRAAVRAPAHASARSPATAASIAAGAGAVATIWPWRASFLRVGAEATPFSPEAPCGSCGGSAGTTGATGRSTCTSTTGGRSGRRTASRWTAPSSTFGYQRPAALRRRVLPRRRSSAATVPFAGGPYVSARATLTVGGKWFAMGGIGWTVPSVFEGPAGTPRWRIVYGFGRLDWRPGTLYRHLPRLGPD